jgi:hypothetical protein
MVITPAAQAATVPAATYAVTTNKAGTPNQAARWQITITTAGTVASMKMTVQPNMLQGVSLSSLRIVTTLPAGKLSTITGGLQYTLAIPKALPVGNRIWMTISGITTPPAGIWPSVETIVSTAGTKLSSGTGTLTMLSQVACPTTGWPADYIKTENARPGTAGWQIDENDATQVSNKLAAYAENPSAKCGDTVSLRVNDLDLATLSMTAYRLGYYGGTGARAVWQTTKGPWLLGGAQPSAQIVVKDTDGSTINMVTAKNWSRSFSFVVDGSWTPGTYLIAIRTSNGQGRYVPIVVRDDQGLHDQRVIINSAEWQAYNPYGGMDAYTSTQSRRISFDRPYLNHSGAGNLLPFEYGYVYWGEKQSMDLSYVMDTDVFANPGQLDNQPMVSLIGHPEYWTVAAAQHLAQARANGTNILSLTGNALYWRIDMGPSSLTGPNREFGITKLPGTDTDTFRMGGLPEQSLLGAQFGCTGAYGNGTANSSWLWTNVAAGTSVPNLIGVEADEQMPGWPTAAGASIVDTVPLYRYHCTWTTNTSGVAVNAPGCPSNCAWDANMKAATIMAITGIPGGRVFHASSINWVSTLLSSSAGGQATLNAISFLQSGVLPNAGVSPNSHADGSHYHLAVPKLQASGPLSPPLPKFNVPDEQPGQ